MVDISGDGKTDRRLSSWKEIAAFFGKDERTVKRWEQRGLPVRRIPRGARSSVFAYQSELEHWLRGPPRSTEPAAAAASAMWLVAVLAAVAIAVLVAAVLFVTISGTRIAMGDAAMAARPVHVAPAEAEALYRSGVIAWSSRTAAGFEAALADFGAAIAIDPDYAAAHAGLANVYNLVSQYTAMPAAEAYGKAAAAADTALALDPELAEAYAAKAFNLFYGSHEFAASAEMFDAALRLAPDAGQTLHWYALTSMHMGDFARPLELIDRALQQMPDSRTIRANKALITFYAGRPDEAIGLLKALKQAEPDYLGTPSYLATIYLAEGRYQEFLGEYEEAARVSNNASRLRIAAAARRGLADGSSTGMLNAMLEAQKREFEAGAEPAYKLAITAALLGNDAATLDYLTTAVSRGESDILGLRIETAFGRLHGNDRFRALLAQVGLPLP